MSSVLAFALFAAILTITPGVDTLLVLRTTALSGRRAGMAATAGIALGCLVWAAASALGISAVLATSRLAFELLRAAGVGYLCWLGVRALVAAASSADQPAEPPATPHPGGRAFRTGLTTNLLNPKVGVFYLSVMPQFLPAGASALVGSLGLGAVHVAEGVLWLSLIILVVNRARAWLTRPSLRRRLGQVTGVAFLGLGLRLALQRAPH